MLRTQAHRGFERAARAVDVARPPARRAEVVLRIEEVRLQRDRAREVLQRGFGLAKLPAHEAETIVRRGKLRRALQRALVSLGCTGEILRLFFRLAEREQRTRRVSAAD